MGRNARAAKTTPTATARAKASAKAKALTAAADAAAAATVANTVANTVTDPGVPNPNPHPNPEGVSMPSVVLDTLAASVTAATGAMDSATTLINGIAARVQAAIDAALANGATAAELAPVQAEADALTAKAADLAAAVAANP